MTYSQSAFDSLAEEDVDHTLASEDIEPGSSGVMENTGAPAEEADIDINEQRKLKFEIVDEDIPEDLADETTDSVRKEGEYERRNSDIPERMTGKLPSSEGIEFAEGQAIRKPVAVIVGQNHKFTVRSRYLRASTGSCHDLCKYGHKHEADKKTKRPVLGTIRETRPLMRTASGDSIASFVPDKETKNKPLLRRLSLPGPISEKVPPTLSLVKHPSKKVAPTQSKPKQVQSEMKPSSVVTPGKSSSRIKLDIPDVTKTVRRTTQDKSRQKVKEIKTKEEAGSYRKGEKEKAKRSMVNSPRTMLKKSPSIKALLVKNLKTFSRSRHQSNSEESKIDRSSEMSEIAVNTNEPTDNNPAENASKSSLSSEKAPNTPRGSRVPKNKGVESNLKGIRLGLSSSAAADTSVLEGETPKKSGFLHAKRNGSIKEDGGSRATTPRAKTNVIHKAKAKKIGTSQPEEKDGTTWKVKFRRGTVLNLQVASNSPKKLRFKRGRILGEDENSKSEAVENLKSKDDVTDESPDAKPEPDKVHLRRHEAAVRKDNVDLNDVIEETASKLVKTRKSKVKALVGAFETVMSFRDRKRMVETSAS